MRTNTHINIKCIFYINKMHILIKNTVQMFRDLLVDRSGFFNQWLKTNNKISMLYNVTAVGLLRLAGECLKRWKKKLLLPSDWLQAVVWVTRTSATAASAVLMGDYAEAEIQFSLDLYCIFSPSWTFILESGTASERTDSIWRTQDTYRDQSDKTQDAETIHWKLVIWTTATSSLSPSYRQP